MLVLKVLGFLELLAGLFKLLLHLPYFVNTFVLNLNVFGGELGGFDLYIRVLIPFRTPFIEDLLAELIPFLHALPRQIYCHLFTVDLGVTMFVVFVFIRDFDEHLGQFFDLTLMILLGFIFINILVFLSKRNLVAFFEVRVRVIRYLL